MLIQCSNCSDEYPAHGAPYRCPRCGGVYDYSAPFVYDPTAVDSAQPGIWRYRHAFALPDNAPVLTLGEGNTPLVWSKVFGRRIGFKCEFLNPTASFKDRGTATLLSFLLSRGVTSAVEDSSGNAGASFAAYAARAGIQARVFIPDATSGAKRAQIEMYGAEIVPILGPRSNAAAAAQRVADQGVIYASHAYLPFNLPGYATLAYELTAELGDAPGSLVLPVGQGGLLLGVARGFQSLLQAGVVSRMPQLIGVQARACAPLWAVFTYGAAGLSWVAEAPTLAQGISVRFPVRGDTVVQTVTATGGFFVAVDEAEIVSGRLALAQMGFYVEPTSAVVWGALAQAATALPDPVVVVLTGSGFKSTLE